MDLCWSKPTRSAIAGAQARAVSRQEIAVDQCLVPLSAPRPAANAVQAADTSSAGVFVAIQFAGEGWIAQGAWEAQLNAGDAAVCVGIRPTERLAAPARPLLLRYPLPELSPVHSQLMQQLPVVLAASYPMTAVAIRVARALHGAAGDLAEPQVGPFVAGLLLMLAAAVEAQQPGSVAQLPKITRFHLERIKAYLRAHLRDPGLTLDTLAQALRLSVAHIHRLFAHEGCTVCEWLWGQRLEHCAAELASAAHGHRSVGEIALSWGFSDPSHFSRAFRKRYSMSPRDWRNRTPWRQARRP
jgi:AraC-like DNA-binding protein